MLCFNILIILFLNLGKLSLYHNKGNFPASEVTYDYYLFNFNNHLTTTDFLL
jgi:hypothetical protein